MSYDRNQQLVALTSNPDTLKCYHLSSNCYSLKQEMAVNEKQVMKPFWEVVQGGPTSAPLPLPWLSDPEVKYLEGNQDFQRILLFKNLLC